jgi:hypothetical protein
VHPIAPRQCGFHALHGLGVYLVSGGCKIAPFATRKDRRRGGGNSVFLGVAGPGGGGAGIGDFVIFFRVTLLRRLAPPLALRSLSVPL